MTAGLSQYVFCDDREVDVDSSIDYRSLIYDLSLYIALSVQVAPASQLGTRVPAQDYDQIRRQCLAKHTLFEDPYFPADDTSLFYSQKLSFKPEWKRPGVSMILTGP